ncbi:hypothetical protein EXQ31_13375 [Clostridium botulinum]|uniref:hypothetical protein n=1 Tax=Clostridium botulinum TaxID=1491 RepID=UPI001A927BCA|nr:hypothetical protein [Clostridium botulinum]MBO0525042.1 hypothetical protein [Clostridium botulinum]MBO0527030.1 hypothetical protein [Clostridium botulinum]MBO0532457.1 hypothetical protein [Clostridium botulinum]MBO0534431.1 hypothetical protein [Clostridium botulinum]MBO0537932.1 hypothetical protein [Clostridium botulinum]
MTILKGIYYYFKDLVDEKSIDYEKIAIIKANDDKNAWDELSIRHKKQYGKIKKPIESMYEFLEKREID